jgi:putative transposase
MNPVRANMTKNPAQYRWSSYRSNAQGKDNPLVTPHPIYRQLGRTREARCDAYKALLRAHIDAEDL